MRQVSFIENINRSSIMPNISYWFIVPGPIGSLRAATLMPTRVVLAWNLPQDPNGIIENYDVEVLGIEFVQSSGGSSRKRKQVESGLAACYQHLNISGVYREIIADTTVSVPLGKT